MKRSNIVEIICILFILLFIYAAVSKLLDYQKFSVQLGKSPLLTKYSSLIAWLIPSIEIIISIMLGVARLKLIGLYASFTLMLLFTGYIIAITRFSDSTPCSCGGVLQNMSWDQHLIFNFCFVLVGLISILLYKTKLPQPN